MFSISLTVNDLQASKNLYEKVGFRVFAGDAEKNWLILKNGNHEKAPKSIRSV